jgi:superfamily II DNA or RNA helicase
MNPILRAYQSDLISRIFYQWQTHRRILAQLPTGGGKSVIFGAIASHFVRAGLRVLLMAHREELIVQAYSHLSHWCECGIGIIKARYPETPLFPVQVASVQSLVNRLERSGHFDLIIIDEAHHTTAASYRAILDNFPNSKILGLTATPVRLDGTGFDDLFDVLECGLGTAELIKACYLSPFKMYADPNPMIVKGVRSTPQSGRYANGGDYSLSQLAKVNDSLEVAGHLVNSYRRYANGLQTVIFAINIEHSESIACTFNIEGISTAHLDGESDSGHRKRTLERFKAGKIQVLTNVGLFDEGVDIPALECVMLARLTKSLSRYLQMCGRVLRIAEGKTHGVDRFLVIRLNRWRSLSERESSGY